jgi:hypothetical protein
MRPSLIQAIGTVALSAAAVFAAEQLVPSKSFLVKAKPGDPTKTKITYKVKEKGSAATVVGDPTTGGATFHVVLTPGGDQCFVLPAQNWSGTAQKGFKYKDNKLTSGAVKSASIKATGKGTFTVAVSLQGKGSEAISVEPGNPTDTYATNLTITGGDSYCSGTASATPKKNDDKQFKVANDSAPSSCAAAFCGGSPSGAFADR